MTTKKQIFTYTCFHTELQTFSIQLGGSVDEWLACWTQVQMGLGSNRSRDAVG